MFEVKKCRLCTRKFRPQTYDQAKRGICPVCVENIKKVEMGFKIQPVKKTRKFGDKTYKWREYVRMKSEADAKVSRLRRQGKSARVTPQPGYGQGGWNIYVRG